MLYAFHILDETSHERSSGTIRPYHGSRLLFATRLYWFSSANAEARVVWTKLTLPPVPTVDERSICTLDELEPWVARVKSIAQDAEETYRSGTTTICASQQLTRFNCKPFSRRDRLRSNPACAKAIRNFYRLRKAGGLTAELAETGWESRAPRPLK
jgi:hypothetical protein